MSKRCPTCTHILIKPEQKAQSVRYKIKLVAANYLPAITVALPHLQTQDATKRTVAKSTPDEDKSANAIMYAGKTYAFHLALTNPLYDPIQVRLSVQRMHVAVSADGTVPEKARRPPFAVSLPTSSFTVAAFAEAWEYEDDEDMFGVEDDELGLGSPRKSGKDKDGRGKTKTVGVLEKKANLTVVGGEVVIGKEARGNVKVHFLISRYLCINANECLFKFNMLVSYTYRSDDPAPPEDDDVPRSPMKGPEVKTFAFYTVVDLGSITPKEASQAVDLDF